MLAGDSDRVAGVGEREKRQRLSVAHWEEAQRRAAAGDFTEAIRFLFLALVYRFDDLWFTGSDEKIRDHVLELAYEHRIGERLLYQIGVGPEIALIREPAQTTGPMSDTRISWTADTLLRYQFTRTTKFDAGYNHYVTGGSGGGSSGPRAWTWPGIPPRAMRSAPASSSRGAAPRASSPCSP